MTPAQHPGIIDPLAAEYVLGTLRGPARRRFEKWLADTPQLGERCRFWEENLMHLADDVRPVRPPDHVWEGIRSRLQLQRPQPRRSNRALAIAASLLLVVGVSALLYWRSQTPGPLASVANIANPVGQQLWEVDVYAQKGRLVVHTGPGVTRTSDRDFELWALPAGGNPVSLGVMPASGSSQRGLTAEQLKALSSSAQVAVTVEPLGGSPTGQPTSKPVFVAPLRVVG